MKKIVLVLLLLAGSLFADKVVVFSASSTKLAMQEIVTMFEKEHTKAKIDIYFSATGKAFAQLSNGFEYDLFLAADASYPKKIVENKEALSEPIVYAYGAVALYAKDRELIKEGLSVLATHKVKKISIANPRLAPYGVAAKEILKNSALEVDEKIVLADNISQSVQFVDSGAADVGLVAYSLIKTKADTAEYMLIDPSKYPPMEQSFVLTKYAKGKPLAKQFADFLTTPQAKAVFEKYGFATPK